MKIDKIDIGGKFIKIVHCLLTFSIIGVVGILLSHMGNSVVQYADDISLLRVFSSDESLAVTQVLSNLKNGNLNPEGFYNYGYLFNSVAYHLLKMLSYFGLISVTEHAAAICMRIISILSFAASGVFMYLILLKLGVDRLLASVFALLFLSFNDFVYWGMHIHPDVLQTLLIVLSFYILLKIKTYPRAIFVAALIQGIAFGTKYSAIFALAVPVFVVLLRAVPVFSLSGKKAALKSSIPILSTVFILFVSGWIIANPYIPLHPVDFLKDFMSEAQHVARGHGRREDADAILWLIILTRELSTPVVMLLFICAIFSTFKMIEALKTANWGTEDHGKVHKREFIFAILCYWIAGTIYLYFFVRMRVPRFFLHLWPAAIIVSAWSLTSAVESIERISNKKVVIIVAAAFITLLTAPISMKNITKIEEELAQKSTSPAIVAGKWLVAHYAGNTTILAGCYSYVPQQHFKNAHIEFDLNLKRIQSNPPRIIVLNSSCPGRFVWKRHGTGLRDKDYILGTYDKTASQLKTMKYLFAADSPYNLVYETDNVAVLEYKK